MFLRHICFGQIRPQYDAIIAQLYHIFDDLHKMPILNGQLAAVANYNDRWPKIVYLVIEELMKHIVHEI